MNVKRIMWMVSLAAVATAQGQILDGRALDANFEVGSGGFNPLVPDFDPNAGNRLVSGNVTGGRAFQGFRPIQPPSSLRIGVPTSRLSIFRRDSFGLSNLRYGVSGFPQRAYFAPEQTVTSLRSIQAGVNVPGSTYGQAALNFPRDGFSSIGASSRPYPYGAGQPLIRPQSLRPLSVPLGSGRSAAQADATLNRFTLGRLYASPTADALQPATPPLLLPLHSGIRSHHLSIGSRLSFGHHGSHDSRSHHGFVWPNSSHHPSSSLHHRSPSIHLGLGFHGGSGHLLGSRIYSPYRHNSVSPYSGNVYYGSSRSKDYDSGNRQTGYSYATSTHDRDSASSLSNGQRYFTERQYDRAAEAFLQAVLADREAGTPKLAYGHALFATGDYDRAAQAIRRGMDRVANWGEQAMNRRDFYSDPAEFDRQLSKLQRYAELNPSNGDAQFLLGYNLYFTGQYGPAADYLGLALQADPNNGRAAYLHGLAVRRTQRPSNAIHLQVDDAAVHEELGDHRY